MGLATARKKDGRSGRQMLANTQSSTQRTFSVCRRRACTYPLLLRWTYSMQRPYHLGSVPPWWSSVELTPLWPVLYLGWPQHLFEIPWTLAISLLSSWMHTCLDLALCYKIEGCQRSLWGRSSGCPPVCFLSTCRPRRLTHSSQSDKRTFCSSVFGTWRQRSWVRTT